VTAPTSPYRQAALDRLASPERLDRLLTITSPRLWAALLGLCLLILTLLGWATFGRIAVTVDGTGILLSEAGVREIEVLGAGVVEALPVRAGDVVPEGALIARIRQPQLAQQVAQASARLASIRSERTQRATFATTNRVLEAERLDAERTDLNRRTAALRERLSFLEQRLRSEREARALGLVTETSVQASVQAVEGARGELALLALEQQANAVRRLQNSNGSAERVAEAEGRVRDAEQQLASLELQLKVASEVRSPYRGVVREVRTSIGQLVGAGQAVVSIELVGVPLQGVAFVSHEGKRIAPGMEVRVSPSTVRREEFGYLVGRVRAVSAQPMTIAGMTRTLGNDLLVQQLAAQGALFLVEITLERDSATTSGFKWSSRRGPAVQIGSGTSIGASVVVERRRPIGMLLPFLRAALGVAA
jgi:HlyD family secretion protein